MINYTLIAYRPNHVDTCRGCRMGSSSSDHKMIFSNDLSQIVEQQIDFEERNDAKTLEYADWEIAVLFDGRSVHEWEFDDERRASGEYFSMLFAKRVERKALRAREAEDARITAEQKAEADRKAAADKKKRDDLETLARLQQEYGPLTA